MSGNVTPVPQSQIVATGPSRAPDGLSTISFSKPEGFPIAQELLSYHRLSILMQHHRYVSFRLNENGEALHLAKDASGKIDVTYAPAGLMPDGTRLKTLDGSGFSSEMGALCADLSQQELKKVLDRVDIKMNARANESLHVHTSMQGYHEVLSSRILMGLTDTGGQNAYMKDLNDAEAKKGYRVINVNNGGALANHPKSNEVREGMHYDFTKEKGGVDLLFVSAPSQTFLYKEAMYDEPDFFQKCAEQIAAQLKTEPQIVKLVDDLKVSKQPEGHVGVYGHYADGGQVAVLLKQELVKDTLAQLAEASSDLVRRVTDPEIMGKLLGTHIITGWFSHSLGYTKERDAAGSPNIDRLNLPKRKALEAGIFANIDLIFPTSPSLAESTKNDYGFDPDMSFNPGINDAFIKAFGRRRYEGQEWNDRHLKVLDLLSKKADPAAEITVDRLKDAQLIMEISRTAYSKGKMFTLAAFHRSLSNVEDAPVRDRVLVMTMPKPEELLLTLIGKGDSEQGVVRSEVLKYHSIIKHLWDNQDFKAFLRAPKVDREELTRILKAADQAEPHDFLRVWDRADLEKAAEVWRREDFQVALDVESYIDENPELKRHVIFQASWPTADYIKIAEVASLFVTSALSEPWGMSVLEAAAAGLLVISSDRVPSVQHAIGAFAKVEKIDDGEAYVNAVAGHIRRCPPNSEMKGKILKAHNALLRHTWDGVATGLLDVTVSTFDRRKEDHRAIFETGVN